MRGGSPATAAPRMRARRLEAVALRRGLRSRRCSAQAPSLTPEALPAVTVPPAPKRRVELRRAPRALVSRGCSSRVDDRSVRPSSAGSVTGDDLASTSRPFACAASAAAGCEAQAHPGPAPRARSKSAATFSAVSGIESMPYCCAACSWIDEAPADRRVVRSRWLRVNARRPSASRTARGSCSRRRRRSSARLRPPRSARAAIADRVEARAAEAVHRRRPAPRPAGPRAAPPCARRCGCPRPPGWRSRGSRRRPRCQSTPAFAPSERGIGSARQVVGAHARERAAVAPDRACGSASQMKAWVIDQSPASAGVLRRKSATVSSRWF